ncbi:hypothetical protein M0813_03674 [Anaeramoeba flamelloides]|uniref:Actin n=1 Tax=Anaeramoeba flamelloides TaxID=1746091 RepID=A0ABQ8XSD9_9EUKA|nr:hypothetical protein M0813_03674 [Anaeramoeba flamelloides]
METIPIVIDNGSSTTKAGFAGVEKPKVVFPTIVGEWKSADLVEERQKDYYIGPEIFKEQDSLLFNKPIEFGLYQNWEWMEKIWQHTFYNELRVSPEDHPVLLAERPASTKVIRENITEIMFETFKVPFMYLANQCALSLYATGKTTGVVIDSGGGVTHVLPVYDGYAIPHAINKTHIGGDQVTDYFTKIVNEERERSFTNSIEDKLKVSGAKEQLGYVALDFEEEMDNASKNTAKFEKSYRLPNKEVICLGNERFRGPEINFNPTLVGSEQFGIHEIVFNSIMKCDRDFRRYLFKNISLAGGNTLFPGFEERLTKEMKQKIKTLEISVTAPPDRKYSAWKGGSILSSLSTFKDMWITTKEYEETGTSIVHKKCF